MNRMSVFLIIAAGLVLLGAWVLRREFRRAPHMPPDYDRPVKPVNAWLSEIKPDRRTGYGKTAPAQNPMDLLRQEELRQKPQEGRN